MHERCLVRQVVDSRLKSVQFMNSVCEMIIANTHSAMTTYLLQKFGRLHEVFLKIRPSYCEAKILRQGPALQLPPDFSEKLSICSLYCI